MSSEVVLFSSRDRVNYEVIPFSSRKSIYIFHHKFLYCAENIFNFFEGLWIVKQLLSEKEDLQQYQENSLHYYTFSECQHMKTFEE